MTPILGVCYHLIRRGRYSGFPPSQRLPNTIVSDFIVDSTLMGLQLQEQLRSYT
jgi:hypothetical protein